MQITQFDTLFEQRYDSRSSQFRYVRYVDPKGSDLSPSPLPNLLEKRPEILRVAEFKHVAGIVDVVGLSVDLPACLQDCKTGWRTWRTIEMSWRALGFVILRY